MGSSKSCRHLSLIFIIALLTQFASTQDSQKFYFPGNTQNHFVPSSYLKTRQPGQRELGFPPKPDSYQEQILFISGNDNQQQVQQPLTPAYGFGSPQFSKTRNPDYFDISPRPFGVPVSGGFSPSKGVRPSSDFLQQSRIRSNIPHQQSQFLQHFNEPINDKGINANRLTSGSGFGNHPSRLSSNSDFSSLANRNVVTTPHYSDESPSAARPQQQLPFRNTRNRFKPSTAQTSPSTSTELVPTHTSKRYNRFGIGRTTASTSKPKTSSSSQSNIPIATNVGSKLNSFQPRRTAFLSREINEPINAVKHKIPQSLGNGRVKIENKAIKLLHRGDTTSTSTQKSTTQLAEVESSEQDELNEENHIVEEPEELLQKENVGSKEKAALNLREEEVDTNATTTTLPSKDNHEDHTLILTSNFFLPGGSQEESNAQTSNEKSSSELAADEHQDESTEANLETTVLNDENDGDVRTTYPPSDYEYEYVEEDESTESATELTKTITTTETTIAPKTTSATADAVTLPALLEVNTRNNVDKEDLKSTLLPETTTTQLKHDDHDSKDIESGEEEEDDEEYYEEFDEDDNEEYTGKPTISPDDPAKSESPEPESTSISSDSTLKSEQGTEISTKESSPDSLDREVISVVTTKSVINGSTAFPSPVTPKIIPLSHEEESIFKDNQVRPAKDSEQLEVADVIIEEPVVDDTTVANATESYVVVASIQTSRSINGARFLPFPAIEQEETKQKLSDLDRKVHAPKGKSKDTETPTEFTSSEVKDIVTTTPVGADQSTTASSTESIIDKLDRVQSELSSGLLSGKYPIISGMDISTQPTRATSSSKFPNIRKFQHKTTASPKVKIHHIDDAEMDELAGLLPVGFKPRPSYKNRKITTTTTTTTTEIPTINEKDTKKPVRNSTIGRSFKNNIVQAQNIDLVGLLPKGYKPPSSNNSAEHDIKSILGNLNFDTDLDKLLPKDYKLQTTPKPAVTLVDDISKFLPAGYKLSTTTTKKPKEPVFLINDDISKFLPPGYKPPKEDEDSTSSSVPGDLIKTLKIDDISHLLPPEYKSNATDIPRDPTNIDIASLLPKNYKPSDDSGKSDIESTKFVPKGSLGNTTTVKPTSTSEATTASSGFKVVFPKGIHKRIGAHRLTTPKSQLSGEVTSSPSVLIKKGPPTRATTEFTGWPTPSTTPISIEKLLEQAKTISINFEDLLSSSSTTTMKPTTTTMTTTTTPKPTKPGYCTLDCDLAATIKIIDGVTWKPELLDHNTLEWKTLAREVEAQLNEVYANAPQLSKWFKKVRIDSFSKGSVLVDYYVELANVTKEVNTLEIKKLFHEALTAPPQPILPNKLEIENETDNEDSMDNLKEYTDEKLVKESFLMGKYIIDPVATDFSVIPKAYAPNVEYDVEDLFIPQWAWVVIVIGVGSLVFVVIFGVTVLLNRQKRSKKTPIPLTNDMLNELKINHMGGDYGVDDFYNLDDAWADTKQPIKPKRFVNSVHDSNGSNIYDSWRSTRHGDYFYDSQKDDSLQRSHRHQMHPQHQGFPIHQQYPDAFADAHQLYTYNNQGSRSRYPRDYDPDF